MQRDSDLQNRLALVQVHTIVELIAGEATKYRQKAARDARSASACSSIPGGRTCLALLCLGTRVRLRGAT
jgi:hypothetical protein